MRSWRFVALFGGGAADGPDGRNEGIRTGAGGSMVAIGGRVADVGGTAHLRAPLGGKQ